jgi:hypothetical protein
MMNTNQERMDANTKEMNTKMGANKAEMIHNFYSLA